MLPEDLKKAIRAHPGRVLREDVDDARTRLCELGVPMESTFAQFFCEFQGPFPFGSWIKELLDVQRFGPSILHVTQFVRDVYQVPSGFVCLTSPEGEGFLLYDMRTEAVYDVGVSQLDDLERGKLAPRWSSFIDYLREYFGCIREP